MKFSRGSAYLLLCVITLALFLLFLRQSGHSYPSRLLLSGSYIARNEDLERVNIFVHPEKYPILNNLIVLPKTHQSELLQKNRQLYQHDKWVETFPGLLLHSAFETEKYQQKFRKNVRILALGHPYALNISEILCSFKNNETTWNESYVTYFSFRQNSKETLIPYTFVCSYHIEDKPVQVSLQKGNFKNITHWLTIHHKEKSEQKREISVCTPPFYNNFNDTRLLAEFLAFYDAAGVSSFTFYDYDISRDVRSYFDLLNQEGMNITIIPWNIPTSMASSVWNYGQLASIQHCLYRNSERTKFVLLVAVDEFLVPRQHFSLVELMSELSSKSKRKIGSYVFRQSFFCLEAVKMNSFSLYTSDRIDKIWPPKIKSNVMVRPETVIEGGIYYVRKHVKGWKSAKVPWQLALVHHYKSCPKQNHTKVTQ
ncbi:hypothetical protein X975_19027, partial [Stegodyphus mimosarum]